MNLRATESQSKARMTQYLLEIGSVLSNREVAHMFGHRPDAPTSVNIRLISRMAKESTFSMMVGHILEVGFQASNMASATSYSQTRKFTSRTLRQENEKSASTMQLKKKTIKLSRDWKKHGSKSKTSGRLLIN